MFTDMAGYTSKAHKDEEVAIRQLAEHRRILRSTFRSNGGTEINAMGDGFLVEFASSLQAVRCAIKIQQLLHERNARLPPERVIKVRIGIHVGDVLYRGRDIYGDAVNIAARIERLAWDGGICVSRTVADDVRRKVDQPIIRLGKYKLKNVEMPIEVHSVGTPDGEELRREASPPTRPRLAVLPLASISPDSKDEYFADGMTDELITALSNIPNLAVIARTSVLRYKGERKGIREIARELNVAAVLEGSVRKSGNKLRVTVQLADGVTEEQSWAKRFDREMVDVFAIQTEIAREVAETMEVRLGLREKRQIERRATHSMDAYALYLKGRYHWNKRDEEGIKTAIELFEQATSQDSAYAPAYAGLADCFRIMASRSLMNPRQALAKAKELALKALELDDTLAEAHAGLANSLDNDWEWEAADREYRKAIALNPSYASAYQWYALYLGHMGDVETSIKMATIAESLDPLSPVISATVFEGYYFAKQYDRGLQQCARGLALDAGFPLIHYSMGLAYIQKLELGEAMKELEKAVALSSGEPEYRAALGYAYATSGRKQRARKILKELNESPRASRPVTAVVLMGLGDVDRAFSALQSGLRDKSPALKHLIADPIFDRLRSDRRYPELLRAMGYRKR